MPGESYLDALQRAHLGKLSGKNCECFFLLLLTCLFLSHLVLNAVKDSIFAGIYFCEFLIFRLISEFVFSLQTCPDVYVKKCFSEILNLQGSCFGNECKNKNLRKKRGNFTVFCMKRFTFFIISEAKYNLKLSIRHVLQTLCRLIFYLTT